MENEKLWSVMNIDNYRDVEFNILSAPIKIKGAMINNLAFEGFW